MQNKKGFSENDFGSMLDKYSYDFHPGDIVAGTVFNNESNNLLIDIGANIAGYLPQEEISLLDKNNKVQEKSISLINATREFFILAHNPKSQQILLSIKRLEYIRGWKRIKQLQVEDVILYAYVTKINKGGIVISLEGIKGFIPNSHLTKKDKNQLKNANIVECKILIADEKKNQLVLSNKCALLTIFSAKFRIGDIVQGEITEIKKYGLFIIINEIPALLHISEIGHKHIEDINKIFKIGYRIKVKIIHIDMKQGRLSVSKRNVIE